SMDAEGQNRRQLTSNDAPDQQPAVAADGRFIFFNGVRDDLWSVRRINRDGSGEKELCRISRPSVLSPTPDGKWVYFSSDFDGRDSLWKVPSEGGAPVRVTSYFGLNPSFSPDGKQVAFTRFESSEIGRAHV